MIDIEVGGVQLGPNPAYAGESFLLTVKVKGKALRWNDVKGRTWDQLSEKRWD